MGFMSKIKGILFDEDEIEVSVDSDELPERTPKEVKRGDKRQTGGFIDHNSDEEDTIKEIIIPKEEEVVEAKMTKDPASLADTNSFDSLDSAIERDFPKEEKEEDISFDEPIKDDFFDELDILSSREERRREVSLEDERPKRSVDDIRREYNIGTPVRKHNDEIKDYRKMVRSEETPTKKPFTVTPVISPVYGILDKNYTADEVVEKRELINKTNSGVKPRMYGPVSYNDQPLPTPKKKDNTLKEDLVELNSTINELISDSITNEDVPVEPVKEEIVEPTEEFVKDVIEDINQVDEVSDYTEDIIIQTENYDDYEDNSIESDYLGNNDIEDAFEPTGEFESVNQRDKEMSQEDESDSTEEIPTVNFEDIVTPPEEDVDDENLDNTIETDLFNLIDSMYKSNDKEEDED